MAKTFKNFNHQLKEFTRNYRSDSHIRDNDDIDIYLDDMDMLDSDELLVDENIVELENTEILKKLNHRKKSEYL